MRRGCLCFVFALVFCVSFPDLCYVRSDDSILVPALYAGILSDLRFALDLLLSGDALLIQACSRFLNALAASWRFRFLGSDCPLIVHC